MVVVVDYGELVGYGSTAMRDTIMLLDRAPEVVGMVGRPLEFLWEERGQAVAHVPDLAVLLDGGGVRLVDCLGSGGPSVLLLHRVRVVEGCVQEAGWEHELASRPDPVELAILRWLSGYRHPRCAAGIAPARLRAVFARPVPLIDGAAQLGDTIATLPAVHHGLWTGQLTAALDRPLTEVTLVSAAGGSRDGEARR